MVGISTLISVGGSSGGSGGGSTSGITSINSATGPAITITQSGIINVIRTGNIINIGAQQSGVLGVNGINVTQVNGNFIVDGSALSGISGSGGGAEVVAQRSFPFVGIFSGIFSHNFGTRNVQVQIIDDGNPPEHIVPDRIIRDNLDQVSVVFNRPQTGTVIIHGPSGLSNGSSTGITSINSDTGPAINIVGVNGATVTNPSAGVILVDVASLSGSVGLSKFAASFVGISSGLFQHNLGSRDVLVQIQDDSGPPRKIIPDNIIFDDLNHVSVLFNGPRSGRIIIIG